MRGRRKSPPEGEYQVVGIWQGLILTIQTFFKAKNNILQILTLIKIKIIMTCVYKEYWVKNGTGAITTAKIGVFLVVGGLFLVQEWIKFCLVEEGFPSSSSREISTILEICCIFLLTSAWFLYCSWYIKAFMIQLLPETS